MARPRTPTARLELNGAFKKNPQRGRDRKNEPIPPGPLGEPPSHLTEDEADCWRELASACPWGMVSDRWLYEQAAKLQAKSRREGDDDCKMCEGEGGWFDDHHKFTQCPRCAGMNVGERAQFLQCLIRIGATPADRSKVGVPKDKEEDNPFAALAAESGKPN